MSSLHRTFVHVIAAAGLLTMSSAGTRAWASGGEPVCVDMPNGSFDQFLAGWTLTPFAHVNGDAFNHDASGIYDASGYQLPDETFFDTRVLGLVLESAAGVFEGVGMASYDLRAETQVVASDRYLRVRRGGGFEFLFLGTGGRGITAEIGVTAADGDGATRVLYSWSNKPEPGCLFGLSVLGTFDSQLVDVYLDLAEAGIEIGETVTVWVRLLVYAETSEPCQFVVTSAYLLVDEFEFCDRQPNKADIDRDGDVDDIDALLFVSVLLGEHFDGLHWAASDVNGDGYADGRDVGPFVAAALDLD